MTKIRVVLDGGDYCDVAADMLTFDEEAVVLWAKEAEIGRHSRRRVTALDLTVGVDESRVRATAAQERLEEIRKRYPNAYRPWTAEQESLLVARHAEGASLAELAEEIGRQPGGIEARLERLGLIEGERTTRHAVAS